MFLRFALGIAYHLVETPPFEYETAIFDIPNIMPFIGLVSNVSWNNGLTFSATKVKFCLTLEFSPDGYPLGTRFLCLFDGGAGPVKALLTFGG